MAEPEVRRSRTVSESELMSYFTALSNWGRWGEDDEFGTLNLITPEVVVEAATLVKSGTRISLAADLDPASPDEFGRGSVVHRYMERHEVGPRMAGFREFIAAVAHGSPTHLGALSHVSWQGSFTTASATRR
jgi:hypothetical protein